MGDSDEEYDRRRRDKFRGERNDYDNRRPPPRGYDRGRGDKMSGGSNWERGPKRDYYGSSKDQIRDRRESFGRGSSPPSKRSRRDWDSNDQPWKGSQDSNTMIPHEKGSGGSTVPSLMSFKDFIIQQEDDIDEVESVRRYHEYKVEFKRTQINDFFVLHKGEEWFEERYHPVKSVERKKTVRNGLRRRLRVFIDLWDTGYMDEVSVHISQSAAVLKLLDRVVTVLEGGTEEDVKALDIPPVKEKPDETEVIQEDGEVKSEQSPEVKKENEELETKPNTYNYDVEGDEESDTKEPLPPGMEDEEDIVPPGMEDEEKPTKKEEDEVEAKREDPSKDTGEDAEEKPYVYDGSQFKRAVSLFIRTVPANVTRLDLKGICKRYPGFLRVALSEPSPERRYARRAWATFDHTVNIKDINWNVSNIRVKDVELSPVVNRDVSNRIRPVNGIACSPMTMQLDVKFALKLARKLDMKNRLYEQEESNGHVVQVKTEITESDGEQREVKSEEVVEELLNLPERNPILENIPDDIEEMITGLELEDEEDDEKEYPVVVNEDLARALDILLLYLRVVHCIDFYNANEYVHEDEMPMRCGIMHVRGPPLEAASKKDVNEWYKGVSSRLEHLLKEEVPATDDEAEKYGKKDEETEVENFIKANTQELAKDKWLCPLSGKKFRGPDFIRKHIMMKHTDSVDNVKAEVKYFNNYVYDRKRPCFPEPKPRATGVTPHSTPHGASSNTPSAPPDGRSWSSASRQPVVFATPAPRPTYSSSAYHTPTGHSTAALDTYGRMSTYPPKTVGRRGGGGSHDRKIIKYRDLDAPEESDFF